MQPNFCRGFPDLLSPLSISRKTGSPYACSAFSLPWMRYGGLRLSSGLVGCWHGRRRKGRLSDNAFGFLQRLVFPISLPVPADRGLGTVLHYCCLFSVTAFSPRKIYLFPKYFHFFGEISVEKWEKIFFLVSTLYLFLLRSPLAIRSSPCPSDGKQWVVCKIGGKEGKWVIVCFVDEGGVHLYL